MEQHEQESQQKASREHSSSMPRKHPVRGEGESGGDRHHPHSLKRKIPMEQQQESQQESQQKTSKEHFSFMSTKHPEGEAQPSNPGTSSANENTSVSPLTEEIRERTGATDASSTLDLWTELFKDNVADGYLIPPDTDLSITAIADLWSEHEHDFDFLNDMQEIDILIDTSTPPAQ